MNFNMADSDTEKRKKTRLRVKFDVLINGLLKANVLDISEGGMFIHTSRPFPEGSELGLSFTPRPGSSFVNVIARVQFVHAGIAIGVVFLNLDELDRAVIKKFVDESLEESGPAGEGVGPDARKKVLIADASTPARMMFKNTLLLKGFAVTEATNNADAIKALSVGMPDLIILGSMMEGMDGEKFMHMLRSHDEWKDVKVLLTSSNMNPDRIARLAVFGVAAILPKMTTTPKKLAEKVEEILGKSE